MYLLLRHEGVTGFMFFDFRSLDRTMGRSLSLVIDIHSSNRAFHPSKCTSTWSVSRSTSTRRAEYLKKISNIHKHKNIKKRVLEVVEFAEACKVCIDQVLNNLFLREELNYTSFAQITAKSKLKRKKYHLFWKSWASSLNPGTHVTPRRTTPLDDFGVAAAASLAVSMVNVCYW